MLHCPSFVSAARLPSRSRPTLVRVAEPGWYSPLSYIRTRCMSAVYIATYARTCCRTSLVFTDVLCSYALLVCRQHRRPPFVRVAEPRWYAPLSYIRKRYSTAVYIADLLSYALHVCRLHRDLRSYALQNLVGIHRCPTFVRAAPLPSSSPTSVRTRCRTSLVRTAVLHS